MKKKIILIVISLLIVILLILICINRNVQSKTNKDNIKEPSEIIKDITPPIITLVDGDITIKEKEEYKEPGYQAIDDIDGDITDKVEIISNLDNSKAGTYTITYTIKDSSNNKAEVSRNIIVKPLPKENTNNKQEPTKKEETSSNSTITESTDSKIATKNSFKNTTTNNEEINNYIKELNTFFSKYKVSIGYVSLENNFTYLYNENKEYFGASLIKNVEAMYVYENKITDKTIIENVKKAISKSDNNAHTYLVKTIGKNNLKSYSKSIGVTLSTCNELFYCNTNVIDQLNYLTHLNKLVNTLDNGKELESYYINSYGNHLSFNNKYDFLHKYGYTPPNYHDVAIFKGEHPYMIVVLTAEANNGIPGTLTQNISEKISGLNDLVTK